MALTLSQQEQIKAAVAEALAAWGTKADDIIDGSTVMFGGNKQRSRRTIYLNALEKGAYVASIDEYVSNKWGTFEQALESLRADLNPPRPSRFSFPTGALPPEWVLEEERQKKAAEEARLFPVIKPNIHARKPGGFKP